MTRRRLEVLVIPALLLSALVLPVPLMADRLPDPLASHWGFDDRPDGSATPSCSLASGSPSVRCSWRSRGARTPVRAARCRRPCPSWASAAFWPAWWRRR